MNMFEEDKARTLKRLPFLRFMDSLGMVAWKEDSYHCARQYLRLLHPLSWFWLLVNVLAAIFSGGIPKTVKELPKVIRDETVWW